MGLLTDGNSWDFHYIRQIDDGYEIYRIPRITTSTPDNIQLVLGIVGHFGFSYYVRSFGALFWDYSKGR